MVTEGFDPSSNNHESLQPSCSSFHLSLNRSGIVDSDLHLGSESGGGYPSQDIWYEYLHDQKDTSKYIIIWSQKQVRHVAWLWCIYVWKYACSYVSMSACTYGWVAVWMDGWMYVFMSFMYLCIVTIPPTKKKTPISKWRCMHTYHTSFMNWIELIYESIGWPLCKKNT